MEGKHATLVRLTQARAMLGSLDPTRSPSQVLLAICVRAARGGDARGPPRQHGHDGWPHHARTPRSIEGDPDTTRQRVALRCSRSRCTRPLERDRPQSSTRTQRPRRPSIARRLSTWGGLMPVPPQRGGMGGHGLPCGGRGEAPHAVRTRPQRLAALACAASATRASHGTASISWRSSRHTS